MVRTILIALCFPIMLISCCTLWTDIDQTGADTYTLTACGRKGTDAVRKKALEEAESFARDEGKSMLPVDFDVTYKINLMHDLVHKCVLTFRLVDAGAAPPAGN